MRQWLLCGVIAIAAATTSLAAGEGWLTDMDLAKQKAAETSRPILVDFTGSDWCGWCIRLDDEVFSQEAFKTYARNNLILLFVDFPQSKPQSPEVQRQNEALANQYMVQGFPTILLLDAKGEVLARTGYRRGGAKAYIDHLKALLAEAKSAAQPEPDETAAEAPAPKEKKGWWPF